jgi:poly(3-hydroxybutyrate) depolymerase
MLRLLALIFWFTGLSVASADELDQYQISASWDKAVVHVPSNFFTQSVDRVDVRQPFPVVLFMHGCAGIGQEENQWARFLKDQGFIVVLPDSFAIPKRVINCSTTEKISNLRLVPVNRLRPAEVAYAMAQLQTKSWADTKNIFLMGHSEGAMAATRTPDMGFKGIIISGFICSLGVKAGASTPLLAVSWASDPYFQKTGFQCDSQWGARNNGTQIVLSGSGHGTSSERLARQAVAEFLGNYTSR